MNTLTGKMRMISKVSFIHINVCTGSAYIYSLHRCIKYLNQYNYLNITLRLSSLYQNILCIRVFTLTY